MGRCAGICKENNSTLYSRNEEIKAQKACDVPKCRPGETGSSAFGTQQNLSSLKFLGSVRLGFMI